MKKLLTILFILFVAISLTACSSKSDVTNTESGKTYIIYSDNSFAPFEYFDTTTNSYIGVDMDIMAAIAEDQGIKYEMHNEGFDASMGAVQSGQADAMIAGMTINDKRRETYDFSESYFDDGQIVAVLAGSGVSSLEDIPTGSHIAAKTSTMGAEAAAAAAEQYGFVVDYYEDSPTMYQAVLNGTALCCFEDRSVMGWAIVSEGIGLETVGDVISPAGYGFAVKKGSNPELIEMFDAGLKNIKASGQYDEILAKYGY